MEELKTVIDEILRSISLTVSKLDLEEVNKLIDLLIEAKRSDKKIMVIGAGRSGLVGRAFAMRLMHLNFNVHVVGETITPAVERDDILLAISGSGTTTVIVTAARIAKKVGAKIVAITSHRNSPLGKQADHTVIVRGRTKLAKDRDYFSRQILGVHEPLAPLGTVFEVASTVFLDSLVTVLMRRLGKTEKDLRARHATIE
ncbi:6-phospho-3-hexuloisomerase [Candidatus Hecatella orcuttiae]|uniref:6-phospho-3-hexuloisomerase n=1 Tax=Candidatus Hecatella orcuttiae TaxID=1935119 RepID=UPI0028683292|nr:6-phospho-3-hexuloisomerase [Candidatus Hecatella orcuttiae]